MYGTLKKGGKEIDYDTVKRQHSHYAQLEKHLLMYRSMINKSVCVGSLIHQIVVLTMGSMVPTTVDNA